MAVKGDRICYVGNISGVSGYLGAQTEMIDARENMLVPGFVDNHCHVLWMGALRALMTTGLYEARSLEDVKRIVRDYASNNPRNPLVIALGWRYDYIPGGFPDKSMADSILNDRPLFLWSYDGNTGWANSMALELMQKRNANAFQRLMPEKGEEGQFTGILLQSDGFNPLDFVPPAELDPDLKEKMFEEMAKTLNESLSVGVTTFNDVQIYRSFLPLLLEFRDRGGLKDVLVRGSYYIGPFDLADEEKLKQDLKCWRDLGNASDEHLILGDSVKLYIEGVTASHTALMLEPYSDKPLDIGNALWTQEDFNRVIEIVDSMGLQACTHGTGDAGIRRIINAYENARRVNGHRDARHRIEHCELPHPDDQRRMAELEIYAAMQPTHLYADKSTEDALGQERLQRFMPWRSLERAGVNLSFGSDWCAGPVNSLYGLLISSTRLNYRQEDDWGPEEKLDLESSIMHYTIDSARALMLEDEVGSIEVGKRADFVIFSIDLLDLDSPEFLLTNKIELGGLDKFVITTMTGGRVVYRRSEMDKG